MMLVINPGHVRFAVFLSCGAFIELCKRRGRRPSMMSQLGYASPPNDASPPNVEELVSSPIGTTTTQTSALGGRRMGLDGSVREDPTTMQCRFCFGTDARDMISPCDCTGSSRYVHARCLRHWQNVSLQNTGNPETRCRVCQATFRNLPRRPRRERFLEWFAPTAKDRTHQYFNAWRDALLNTLVPIAADADCREFNRLGDVVETILGCEVRVFYSREVQRGNKLFILLRKWFHNLEKTHVYTYIARTLGRMLIAGVSSVVEDDGTMVRSRHRVNAFVPFVTAIRDVLVCLQTPIESLMRFHVPYVYACSVIERYPQFRVNCGMYDNYTNRNNSNGRRRRNQQSPSIMESFFAIGKEEANAIANIRNNSNNNNVNATNANGGRNPYLGARPPLRGRRSRNNTTHNNRNTNNNRLQFGRFTFNQRAETARA